MNGFFCSIGSIKNGKYSLFEINFTQSFKVQDDS